MGKFYPTPVRPKPESISGIHHWMLTNANYTYVMRRIKDPLRKAFIMAYKKLPEPLRKQVLEKVLKMMADRTPIPTHANVHRANTHKLVEARDWFFKHWNNPERKELFEAVWNLFIIEYDHDGDIAIPFDMVFLYLQEHGWESLLPGLPAKFWINPTEEERDLIRAGRHKEYVRYDIDHT